MLKFFAGNWLIWALLAAILAGSLAGWRWLEVRETIAVERAQYKYDRAQFEHERTQFQIQERIAREASNAYETQLAALQSERAALVEHNRSLQITARRLIPAISITARRLDDPAPEPPRYREYEIDTGRLADFASACQADAEQLAALQGWARDIHASR